MSDEDLDDLESENQEVDDTFEVDDIYGDSAQEEQPDVSDLQEKNKKLFNRAKTAEAEAKELKKQLADKAEAPTKSTNGDFLSREEGILIAQGMNPDDLEELKDVAQAKGLSLLKAKDTTLFQGFLEKQEKARKAEKAKLNSSKDSQETQTQQVSDMSRTDHEALVKEKMANVR